MNPDELSPLWIFAYGSLIWRPDFPVEEEHPARIKGYVRRFWQASEDHRGTKETPGRVLTLVPRSDEYCQGVLYRVASKERERVLEMLSVREKGGYTPLVLPAETRGGDMVDALVYVANAENPLYVGEEAESTTVQTILSSEGPSGHNIEYVLRLSDALSGRDLSCEHVFRMANLLVDPDRVFDEEDA